MNTFLLAAVAIGLVAFLVINRKRQAAAAAAPGSERTPAAPRARGRAKTRRDGSIQGYPDPVPEAPAAAAMAETAASSLSAVIEPLPAAAPAPPPAEPLAAAGDWGFDDMIVEPGWPMPGEIAGAWPAGAPAAPAPVAAAPMAVAVEEPVTPSDIAGAAEAATGEWELPVTAPPPPADPAPWVEAATGDEPAMEAWVPGITEVEPVVLPDAEPVDLVEAVETVEADDAPALVWAEPEPHGGPGPDAFAADEVAGPPAWQPEEAAEPEPVTADPVIAAPVIAEPVPEEPVAADPVATDPVLPAWEPEPAPVVVEEPWQPIAEPSAPVAAIVVDADPDEQIDAVAEGLPQAVAALTPVIAVGDARGVTPRMTAVLRALADEPRSLPELGRALGVSRPVVADVCSRLEQLELVWRERDPDDRRRTLVVPTLRGLKLADEAVPGLDRDAVAGALDRLSPAERAALVSAVRVLGAPSAR